MLDRVASYSSSGAPTSGTTLATTADNELWLVVTMSRGGGGHTDPTDGFTIAESLMTGAGSFSLLERVVTESGPASAGLSGSGDYASVIATLRRGD